MSSSQASRRPRFPLRPTLVVPGLLVLFLGWCLWHFGLGMEFGLAVVVGTLVARQLWQARRVKDTFQRLAENRLGQSSGGSSPTVVFDHLGSPVTLRLLAGDETPDTTQLSLAWPEAGMTFSLSRRTGMEGAKKVLGYRFVTFDDPAFDTLFALSSGYNEPKVRVTWNPAARRLAIDLAARFAPMGVELQARSLMISTDLQLVEYVELEGFATLALELADALRPSSPDEES